MGKEHFSILRIIIIGAFITTTIICSNFLIQVGHKRALISQERPIHQQKIWDYTLLDTYKTAEEICGPWQVVKRDKGNDVFVFKDLIQIEDLLNSCRNELKISESEAVNFQIGIVEEIAHSTDEFARLKSEDDNLLVQEYWLLVGFVGSLVGIFALMSLLVFSH